MSNVTVFKLVSGEEIVGELQAKAIGATKVKIKNTLSLQPFPNGAVGFADFMTSAVVETIEIDEAHIMLQLPATEECATQFEEIIKELATKQSGLVVAEKQDIIL